MAGLLNVFQNSGMSGSTPAMPSKLAPTPMGVKANNPAVDNAPPATTSLPSKYQSTNQPVMPDQNLYGGAPQQPQQPQSQSVKQTDGSTTLFAPGYGGANGTPTNTGNGPLTTPNGTQVNAGGQVIAPAPQNNTGTAPGILNTLMNTAGGNTAIGQNAAQLAQNYGAQIADVGRQGANMQAGDLTTGTNVVGEGNAAVAANSASQRMNALAAAESAALQGTGQQLTAQNQMQTGVLGALGQATQLQSSPYGTPQVNVATGQTYSGGQPIGSGSGGAIQPNDPAYSALQQYAQMAASGQISAIPSAWTSNPVINAQINQMAQQINPSYSPITSAAQGAATSSNVQTAGTAGVTANQQVFNKAYGDYTSLQNTVQNVDQFGQLLTSGMIAPDGTQINPSNAKYANMSIANIRSQLSSGQQAQFDSTLAALQSKVSGLLSVGGSEIPTKLSSDASKILDGTLPLGSLNDVLSRIQAEGNILLSNQAGVVNNAYAGIQNPAGSTNSNANTNSTQPIGYY